MLNKLYNKIFNKCDHIWKLEREIEVYENSSSKYPIENRQVYICTKCLKSKKIIL